MSDKLQVGTRESCQCDNCTNACIHKPGWFKPGEIEKAAAFLGMSTKDFFDKYLGIDYWVGDLVFVLAPATTKMELGIEYPYKPLGQCIFFKNGLCSIHSVKPFECKDTYHTDIKDGRAKDRHKAIADSWREDRHQKQIKDLLGREPEEAEGSFLDLFMGNF